MSILPTNQMQSETLGAFLAKQKNQLQMALPKHLNVDRLLRIALTEVRKNTALARCSKESLYSSLMQAGQLGIEPGGSLGQGYLIPYGAECKFMLGYRGMIDLARRSGEIISICARIVNKNDKFTLQFGINEDLKHEPARENAGSMELVYAIAHLKGGGHQFEVMTKEEIDAIRKRSASGKSGPWVTDYNEMARKTVVRRLFKYLPLSIELREQLDVEEEKEFVDVDYEIVNEQNGLASKLKPSKINIESTTTNGIDIPYENVMTSNSFSTKDAPGSAEFFSDENDDNGDKK